MYYLSMAQDVLAQNTLESPEGKQKKWESKSISLAYAGENFIRPGMQFSVDFIPLKRRKHEFMFSPVATFFVFRPFYTSALFGARAMYQWHSSSGFTLRPLGISTSYKHKFLNAPVYSVNNGTVERIKDLGYGNVHALATTGLAYNFSDKIGWPLSIYTDVGISAEPYFGVFRFHYEFYLGFSYHLSHIKNKSQ